MTQRQDAPRRAEPELPSHPQTNAGKEAATRLAARFAIARAIIEARVERGWTQEKLAREAGTKQSRISEMEGARGNPTLDTIERICRALELSLSIRSATSKEPVTDKSLCRPLGDRRFPTIHILSVPRFQSVLEETQTVSEGIPAAIASRLGPTLWKRQSNTK